MGRRENGDRVPLVLILLQDLSGGVLGKFLWIVLFKGIEGCQNAAISKGQQHSLDGIIAWGHGRVAQR